MSSLELTVGIVGICSLVLVLYVVTCYYRHGVRYFRTWTDLGVGGPKPWPVFGTILPLLIKGVVKYDRELIKKYGRIIGTFEGRFPVLILADEEVVKAVLVKNFANFPDRRFSALDPFPVNKTLAKLTGHRWKVVRSLLTPSFSTAKLKVMTSSINRCAITLTENLSQKSGGHRPLPFKDFCGTFALDVIARILFGLELDSQNDPDDPFIYHAQRFFKHRPPTMTSLALFALPCLMPVLSYFNVRPTVLPKDSLQFFIDTISHTIELHSEESRKQTDFLQLLLNAEEKSTGTSHSQPSSDDSADSSANSTDGAGLSRDEVVAQVFMFLLAGYETTATAAAMLAYNLSRNPVCQRRLQQEIDEHLGTQEEVTCDDLVDMTYMQMCIEESLRLFPPVLRIDRICAKETKIGSLTIPRGTLVTIPIHAVNNDPEYWPEPDQFRPERFSHSARFERSPSSYLSFGLGPRGCIGRRLATLELKILFVHILRRFTIQQPYESMNQHIEFEKGVLLQLKRPLLLKLESRNPRNAKNN